jgi:Lon protease-like protein
VELPNEIPVMTLPDAVLFPGETLPLYIFEPRYRKMLSDVLEGGRMFSVARRRPSSPHETPETVAGIGLVSASVESPDGTSHLTLHGLARIELGDEVPGTPYRVHRIRVIKRPAGDNPVIPPLLDRMRHLATSRIQEGALLPSSSLEQLDEAEQANLQAQLKESLEQLSSHIQNESNPEKAADLAACALLSCPDQRQTILETRDLEDRLHRLIEFLDTDDPFPEF